MSELSGQAREFGKIGFSEKEARTKVDKARAKQDDASTEELIKAVLRG